MLLLCVLFLFLPVCVCMLPQPATEGFEDKLGALPLRRKALIAMGVQTKYGAV